MKKTPLLLVIVGLSSLSHATIAYNNFGPNDEYDMDNSWTIGDPSVNQVLAFQFTSLESGTLASVELAMTSFVPGNMNIILYEDQSDAIGNQMVAWGHALNSTGISTFNNAFPSIQLTAGNKYWLETRAVDGVLNGGWNQNDIGINGLATFSNDFGNGQTVLRQGAFRVNVEAVPEPATMTILAGAVALAALKRRKK